MNSGKTQLPTIKGYRKKLAGHSFDGNSITSYTSKEGEVVYVKAEDNGNTVSVHEMQFDSEVVVLLQEQGQNVIMTQN